LDNCAAVEVDTPGAEIGPVLRRSVYQSTWSRSRFKPANVLSEGLVASNAKLYSFLVRN
jgi:hypothetical protein